MYEWSEEHKMIRDAVRQFIEAEVRPLRDELEFGDTPPYDVIRSFYRTFGMDQMARDSFSRRIKRDKEVEAGTAAPLEGREPAGNNAGMTLIPIIELCRCSPGLVTAMGVSTGLAAATIMSRGTVRQKE
ncbi:MAG: acyl-CoA dehydrogenase, partial [Actinobacteria bacterium]|nr:acyl-CoA dehydrogenase [Actinomycetota bacterium]